jgi:TolB-like protein
MPNKLSQFWQELKRRNVVRVITVYAAASFVVLELVDILAPSLGLPDWTLNLVLILLIVGFIVAIILSWIYDIHPEEGMVKTEPIEKGKAADIPKFSNRWKIASYISFVTIVGLIILNIIPRTGKKEVLEKSIAVLPFINDSPDQANAYFINGIMEEILLNLQAIKDLRVISRSSVEQYRNSNRPSIPEIAEDLDVNYIVEGSGQKYGNTFVLRVQLIEGAKDNHLWGESYKKEIESTEVIISIQNQIAESIAEELEALITAEEKEIISHIPTTNLIAYDLYLKAKDQHALYREEGTDIDALNKAISYYQLILEYDTAFASAYTGLALAYRNKYYGATYFEDDFLDSTLALADIALSLDKHLEEAYRVKALYYRDYGMYNKAIEEYNLALKYNPNSWQAYGDLAQTYWQIGDHVKLVENYMYAIQLNKGKELPDLLRFLGQDFIFLGLKDLGEQYYKKAFEIDNDLTEYNSRFRYLEFMNFNRGKIIYEERLDEDLKRLKADSTLNLGYRIGYSYSVLGLDDSAYIYYKMFVDNLEESEYSGLSVLHRLGYGYWKAGHFEEAKTFFNKHLFQCKESIKLNRPYANRMGAIYDLAGYYAFNGEKEKAYEYLNQFLNERNFFGSYWFGWILYDPMFNDIRGEARFQNIISQMENKDRKEKERVISWLEENDML